MSLLDIDIRAATRVSLKAPTKEELLRFAQKVVKPCSSYSRPELLEQLTKAVKGDRARAEKGFTLMLEAGVIEHNPFADNFYLGGSTPF